MLKLWRSPQRPRQGQTRVGAPSALPSREALWLTLPLLLLALAWPSTARAQATTWLYAGGGASVLERGERETHSLVQVDTGLGTSATHPLVLGGLFRMQGYLGTGLDLGVVARLVNRGFALGGFGVGLDLGVSQRWWGENTTLLMGNVVLGGPWGLTATAGATLGPDDTRGYFASLGLDFARLTVHRHSGLDWFSNPMRSPGE